MRRNLNILVVIAAMLSLIFTLTGGPVQAAPAAPAKTTTTPEEEQVSARCPADDPCLPPAKYANRKFNKGKMGNARNAVMGKSFESPRKMFRKFKRKYNAKVSSKSVSARVAARAPGARTVWRQMFSSNGCWQDFAYKEYRVSSNVCNFDNQRYSYNAPRIPDPNYQNAVIGITITICAGGVAASWVSGGATLVLISQSTACTWAAALAFKNND